jgi:hypothetical protein
LIAAPTRKIAKPIRGGGGKKSQKNDDNGPIQVNPAPVRAQGAQSTVGGLWEIFRPKSKEENPYTSASIERK